MLNKEIATATKIIGTLLLSAMALGVPVIFTLSIVFDWPGFVIILSGIILLAEYMLIGDLLYYAAEDVDD